MSGTALSIFWLIAGAFLVALEVFGFSGIGLVFAGLGAICTAITIEMGYARPDSLISQFAWFFGYTTAWGLVLWKPLQRLHKPKEGGGYSNIIGDYAVTEGVGLTKGKLGSVRWSGTIAQAELSPGSSLQNVNGGERVKIVALRGSTLIVEKA